MVAEYEGTSTTSNHFKNGGGNREAYYLAAENTADASKHSVLAGSAPAGTVLRLKKSFKTATYPQADGKPILFDDTLETTLDVPADGRYEWHINPSTRPVVAKDRGRHATGSPSAPINFTGNPTTTTPCADADTDDETCWNDHAFTVPGGSVDNAKVSVGIHWETPTTDWDMTVFRDTNGDGSSVNETQVVGKSQQGPSDAEETTFTEPAVVPGGKYVARVVNYAALEPYEGTVKFAGPDPFVPGQTESWTLTCERPDGTVLTSQAVTIARGERQTPDLSACAAAVAAQQPAGPTTSQAGAHGVRVRLRLPRGQPDAARPPRALRLQPPPGTARAGRRLPGVGRQAGAHGAADRALPQPHQGVHVEREADARRE